MPATGPTPPSPPAPARGGIARRMAAALTAALALALAAAMLVPGAAAARGFDAARVTASVVYVAIDLNGRQVGRASGFVVAPGIVVTNAHVTWTGNTFLIVNNGDDGSKALRGEPIYVSPAEDIAVLRVPRLQAPALRIAAGEPALGVPVWALGYPGDADIVSAEDRALVTLTTGTVSRLLTGHTGTSGAATRLVQHDAVIAPGSSGGPLIDACYRVVGINAEGTGTDLRYLFAISATQLPGVLARAGVTAEVSGEACGDSPAAARGATAPGAQAAAPGGATGSPAAGGVPASDAGVAPPAAPGAPSSPAPADAAAPAPDAIAEPATAPSTDQTIAERQGLIAAAQRRAQAAHARAAAARAAAAAAHAAHDEAEARRQQQIADDAERTARDQADYARKLEDQLAGLRPALWQQGWPVAAALAGALLAALAVGLSARQVRRGRRAAAARAAEVAHAEAALAARDGRDAVLTGAGGTLVLPGQTLNGGLVLGRSPDRADVLLARSTVSRRHARFDLADGALTLTDLGSENGTRVNDRRLTPHRPEPLRDGDRVSFADQSFTLQWIQRKEPGHA